ncbi:MAG: hypothetical protein HFK04_00255 [Oscillospiraceae bacterium]|nr:hypothetical protein [Oscillospiraceae bacterium]
MGQNAYGQRGRAVGAERWTQLPFGTERKGLARMAPEETCRKDYKLTEQGETALRL